MVAQLVYVVKEESIGYYSSEQIHINNGRMKSYFFTIASNLTFYLIFLGSR